MKLPRIRYVEDKHDFLARLATGRRVLHVGCADALADIEMKADAGRFLHARLAESARELWGVDSDETGVERLRERFEPSRLVVGDAERLELDHVGGQPFDLVVAAEIIEHLTNPGGLLTSAHKLLAPEGRLCITTPNGALSLKTFLHSMGGIEDVAPEHVILFSFSSLTAIYARFGYTEPDWFTALERHGSSRNRAMNALLGPFVRRLPQYADCLISITRPTTLPEPKNP